MLVAAASMAVAVVDSMAAAADTAAVDTGKIRAS
jgi:hypothetical protein